MVTLGSSKKPATQKDNAKSSSKPQHGVPAKDYSKSYGKKGKG